MRKSWILAGVGLAVLATGPMAHAQEQGGVLRYAVVAEPSTYDLHASNSFADSHYVAPHYSTLVTYDWDNFPEIVPDLAESWEVSEDGLTFTFKLRDGVTFHDGSTMDSEDVKASFDRLRNPPEGVVSVRQALFEDIASIETPDPLTVVLTLSQPNAAMLDTIAAPFNAIYSSDDLAADPEFPETNINGTGPFVFDEYIPGSHWVASRFEDYYKEGQPYLDGFEAIQLDQSALINAVIAGQVQAEFRGISPAQAQQIEQEAGDEVDIQERLLLTAWMVTLNSDFEAFKDPRVREALTLAIDRHESLDQLGTVTYTHRGEPSGFTVPGTPFALTEDQLAELPGYGRDIEAAREEAKRLLAEAGYEDLSFTLTNRAIPQPYEALGLFVIDQWRRIGVEVEMANEPSNQYLESRSNGNFEALIDFAPNFSADPSPLLFKFVSGSEANYGDYSDPEIDQLFEAQARELNREKRIDVVHDLERELINESWNLMIAFSDRLIPVAEEVKGYQIAPSHMLNIKFDDVWIEQEE